jgi:hypothetical protein
MTLGEERTDFTHKEREGHDVTIRVFPDAGHGLLDVPPSAQPRRPR